MAKGKRLTREDLARSVEAVTRLGDTVAAASELGITRKSLQDHMRYARARGLAEPKPAPLSEAELRRRARDAARIRYQCEAERRLREIVRVFAAHGDAAAAVLGITEHALRLNLRKARAQGLIPADAPSPAPIAIDVRPRGQRRALIDVRALRSMACRGNNMDSAGLMAMLAASKPRAGVSV